MSSEKSTGVRPQLMYLIFFPLLRFLLGLAYRFRYIGTENIPVSGPAIFAGNHTSNLDPFCIAFALPVSRPISFMAKAEMFANPVTDWFFRSVHQFPVNRGAADRQAIRHAVGILSQGGLLGIFPQGTRSASGEVEQAQSGAAFIALQAGATIVPAGIIHGPRRLFRRDVSVAFSEPIRPEEFESLPKRERIEKMTERLVAGINAAIGEAAGSERA